MRGIAILLVVFQHCTGSNNTAGGLILSFHMPLFFFISGSCFSFGIGGGKSFIINKLRRLLIPQVTFAVVNYVTFVAIEWVKGTPPSALAFLNFLTAWFLLALFAMFILMYPILSLVKSRVAVALLALAIFAAFCFTDYNDLVVVQQTMAALVFGLLGFLCRPCLDKYAVSESSFKGYGWLSLIVCTIIACFNDTVFMYINEYGNKLLFALTSVLGIYSIVDISVSLRNTNFLQWCGINSIIIYVLHFPMFRVSGVVCREFGSSFPGGAYVLSLIAFIVVLLIVSTAVVFCNKYLWWAFGKGRQKPVVR